MSGQLTIPCDPGEVSDGHHTFRELYEHRHMLFIALMKLMPENAWYSEVHADGTGFEGWFIAGVYLPVASLGGRTLEPITYHLPNRLMCLMKETGAIKRQVAPEYDGHTSNDVLDRLRKHIWSAR